MQITLSRKPMFLAMLAAAALAVIPAQASLVITVQSVIVAPGSTNDALDVSLMNTGPASATIGGFSFDISTANPGVIFDSAIFSTTVGPYIFAGMSFDQDFGFPLATATGTSLQASDLSDGTGATVAAGSTVGLGHVIFHVAASTVSGPIPVNLIAFPASSLSDPNGANLTFTGNGGTITVASVATVPEPATFGMLGGALVWIGMKHRRRSS